MPEQLVDGIPRFAPGTILAARVAIALTSDFDRLAAERDRLAQTFARCRIAATIVEASN